MNWQAVQEDLVVALVVALAGANVAWLLNTIRKMKADINHAHTKIRGLNHGNNDSQDSLQAGAQVTDRNRSG